MIKFLSSEKRAMRIADEEKYNFAVESHKRLVLDNGRTIQHGEYVTDYKGVKAVVEDRPGDYEHFGSMFELSDHEKEQRKIQLDQDLKFRITIPRWAKTDFMKELVIAIVGSVVVIGLGKI